MQSNLTLSMIDVSTSLYQNLDIFNILVTSSLTQCSGVQPALSSSSRGCPLSIMLITSLRLLGVCNATLRGYSALEFFLVYSVGSDLESSEPLDTVSAGLLVTHMALVPCTRHLTTSGTTDTTDTSPCHILS